MGAKVQVKLRQILAGHRQGVYALCRGDGGLLYSAGGDGYIVEWKPLEDPDGKVIATVPEPVYALAFDPHSRRLFAGSHSGAWYIIQQGQARKISAHSAGLFAMLIHHDAVITAGGDGKLLVWNHQTELLRNIPVSSRSLRKIIAIPGGYAVASSDGRVYFLNEYFEKTGAWQAQKLSVFALEWLPETHSLVSGGRDAVLKIMHNLREENQSEIAAHLLHIHDLKLSPDGRFVASASMDKTIKIWDPVSMELLKVLDAPKFGIHKSSVNALQWMSDSVLVSASDDRNLAVWELE